MALDFEYFIYALDINKDKMTAAWQCPNEETAERIYQIVSQKMEEEHGVGGGGFDFDFGIAVTEKGDDSHNELEYIAPPRHEKEKWTRKLLCKYNDFVFAAKQTEKYLRTRKKRPRYIQFMEFVKMALEEKPLPPTAEKSKSSKPVKLRKERYKKYEALVEAYLEYLKKSVLEGDTPSASVANLSYKEIAKVIAKTDGFSDIQIESIEHRVRHTEAWKNRKETLKKIYDTATSRNRRTGNTPYQDVQ
jgi:CRISPR/Cas system-associated endoribonuclease Cas2